MGLSVEVMRDRINTVFERYGTTVDIKRVTDPVYDDRGDILAETFDTVTTKAIPFSLLFQKDQQPFGDIKTGDLGLGVPHTISIDQGDFVEFDGDKYEVQESDKHYLPGNVVTLVRLTRVVD